MVDNSIPTNQFHPYQPPTAVPNATEQRGGLNGMLGKAGIRPDRLRENVRGSVERVRGYAQQHPGALLGGLAALAIGLGMLRGRGMR